MEQQKPSHHLRGMLTAGVSREPDTDGGDK